MLDEIKLPNGKLMSWEEFSKLTQQRQSALLSDYRGGKHQNSKKVSTPAGNFGCAHEAAKHYGVSIGSLSRWIRDKKEGFEYLTKPKVRARYVYTKELTGVNSKQSKPIKTPDGIFVSIREAGKFYGVTSETVRYWITKSKKDSFQYIDNPVNLKSHPNQSARRKRLVTPAGVFESLKSAAEFFEINTGTLKSVMKADSRFHYLDDREDVKLMTFDKNFKIVKRFISKPVVTPVGTFSSIKEAAKANSMRTAALRSKIGKVDGFYFSN